MYTIWCMMCHLSNILYFTHPLSVLSLFHSSDYTYVPSRGMIDLAEGDEKVVTFVLLNPPPDGIFEFDFNVTISTVDGTATGMPD